MAIRAAENRGTTKHYVTADATSTGKPASADARHVIGIHATKSATKPNHAVDCGKVNQKVELNERQSFEPVVLYIILLVNITPFKNIDQNLFITLEANIAICMVEGIQDV